MTGVTRRLRHYPMWRMRLGLLGFFILAGWGAWTLYNSIVPILTIADPLEHDALLVASASSGASFFIADLGVALQVASLNPIIGSEPTQVAIAVPTPTSTRPLPSPSGTRVSSNATLAPLTATPFAAIVPAPTRTTAPSRIPSPASVAPPPSSNPPSAVVGFQISTCGDITAPGTYRLLNPVTSIGDCLTIRSSDVTLDCGGNMISGQAQRNYGIAVRRFNVFGLVAPNNIEVRNCRVSQFKTGIWVEAGTNVYIHHNDSSGNNAEVDGNRFGEFLGTATSAGIQLNSTRGGRLDNNTTNANAIGIDVRASSNVQVRGNTSSNNSAWGINLIQTTGATVANNTTADNIRTCLWGAGAKGPGCDAAGIAIQNGSSGNTITGNRVLGSNGNGIFIKAHALPCGDNNVISNNTIDGPMYNGIEIGFCKGNQIVGNEIMNSLDGIWMSFVTQTTIRDNNIHDMRNHGIISLNSRNSDISNNSLTKDREAIYMYFETVNPNVYFWFNAAAYKSERNCICGNRITDNVSAGIHLNNTIYSQINGNTLRFNGVNTWYEGASDGNVIEGNVELALLPIDSLAFLDFR